MTSTFPKPPIPLNEEQRIAALESLQILESIPEPQLNDLTLLASEICGTPISFISLVHRDRQFFKAKVGMDIDESSRNASFCSYTVAESKTFIVEDTLKDNRFHDNVFVTGEPGLRFYAGTPLKTADGFSFGTLCVADSAPRVLTSRQVKALETLATQVADHYIKISLNRRLIEKEKFIDTMLATVPDLFTYVDHKGCFRYVSSTFERAFQVKANEVYGCKVIEVVGAAHYSQIETFLNNALRGESQAFQISTSYPKDPKHKVTICYHYYPDVSADGTINGVFSVSRDITELKNAETEAILQGERLEATLKEAVASEQAFRSIFDNSPVGIVQLSLDLKYLSANAAYCNFIGYSERELLNMCIYDVTHPEDLNHAIDLAHRFRSKPDKVTRIERRYLTKSGHIVWGVVSIRPFTLHDDHDSILTVIEDVTEKKKQEDELKSIHARMISSAKMASLGEMAGGIAHEINNPLAIINLKTDLLKRLLRNGAHDMEKLEAGLSDVKSTANRIAKIVKGLRQFSRSGEEDPMERILFSKIMDDTLELCKQRFSNYNIKLHVTIISDEWLECRPTQIAQILMSLLSNAFDAVESLDDKWVAVDVSTRDHLLHIEVTDSGTGIPPTVVEKMMYPFFTTKDVGKGTGLGLSISSGIAGSHNGRLYYDPLKGNTCFGLDLPILRRNAA